MPVTHSVLATMTTGQKLTVLKTTTNRFLRHQKWLLLMVVILWFVGAYLGSLPSIRQTESFVISIVFSLVETAVGYYAVWREILITREVEPH
jgi:hypothetical protein